MRKLSSPRLLKAPSQSVYAMIDLKSSQKSLCKWDSIKWVFSFTFMMTSSNGNIFRVTGHLWGEFTGIRWIPPHKGQWREDLMFDLCLNKRLREQSWGWWFETLWRPLWRHCNVKTINSFDILHFVRDIAPYNFRILQEHTQSWAGPVCHPRTTIFTDRLLLVLFW